MPVPTIAAMPAAPSRVGDAANFYNEAFTFLEAQPDFATECNDVAAWFDAAKFNPNDWGDLSAIAGAGSPVTITNHITAAPSNPPSTGFDFANGMDATLASFATFITEANAVATYIDGFVDPLGIDDPLAPDVSTVSASPARGDAQAAFNASSSSFYGSARTFGYTLNALADYVTEALGGTDDWGLLGEAIATTDDWGLITA